MVARTAAWILFGTAILGWLLTLALSAAELASVDTALVSAWLGYVGIGALVASRRPDNSVGWILIAMGSSGVALRLADASAADASRSPDPALWPLSDPWILGGLLNLWVVSFALLAVLVLVFPTGRPPSPRWRGVLWAAAILVPIGLVTSGSSDEPEVTTFPLVPLLFGESAPLVIEAGQAIVGIGLMVLWVVAVASLVVRVRRSGGVERQQLKWFMFASALFAVVYVAAGVAFFIPALRALDPEVTIPVAMFGGVPFILALALLPVSVAIAILRYRLYDIDVLINRTLVYGVLSAALALTYVAGVVLFQSLLRPLTDGSEVAVAGSTLLVVALFQPLRRRIQDAVDRRFYRARYDAARTLDAFAGRLRDQVDLDELWHELVAVSAETVQPQHVSVWLRPTRR